MMKISKDILNELIDAYEDNDIMHHYFLNVETGEIEFLSDFDPDEELADRIDEGFGEIYFRIPQITSSEGYDVMEAFADTVTSANLRNRLYNALSGSKGVFRRFKDVLANYPEEIDRYYQYLHNYSEEKIMEWLEEEEIDVEMSE